MNGVQTTSVWFKGQNFCRKSELDSVQILAEFGRWNSAIHGTWIVVYPITIRKNNVYHWINETFVDRNKIKETIKDGPQKMLQNYIQLIC